MVAEIPDAALGEEVPLREIDGRLKKLWESNKAMSRASLMNFAIYAECPDSLAKNTEVIREVTREHACRALLIAVEPGDGEPGVRAWITAHCQLGDGGKKHVCSEQVSFLIHGCGSTVVANTLFGHVDSDLPLTLWWQGDFSGNWEPWLFTEINRGLSIPIFENCQSILFIAGNEIATEGWRRDIGNNDASTVISYTVGNNSNLIFSNNQGNS